jgi:hypothetical protein
VCYNIACPPRRTGNGILALIWVIAIQNSGCSNKTTHTTLLLPCQQNVHQAAGISRCAVGPLEVLGFDGSDPRGLLKGGEGFGFHPLVAVLFVGLGLQVEVGMLLQQPNPFDFLLVEAEKTAGTAAGIMAFFAVGFERQGFVVCGDANARLPKDAENVVADEVVGIVEQRVIGEMGQGVGRGLQIGKHGAVEGDGVEGKEFLELAVAGVGDAEGLRKDFQATGLQRAIGRLVFVVGADAFHLRRREDFRDDIFAPNILPERKDALDVGLLGNVALAVFVPPDADVGNHKIVAHKVLKGFQFELFGTPPRIAGRKIPPILLNEMVKRRIVVTLPRSGKPRDFLAKVGFKVVDESIGLVQFLAGVAAIVFDVELRITLLHVDGQRGGIFTS